MLMEGIKIHEVQVFAENKLRDCKLVDWLEESGPVLHPLMFQYVQVNVCAFKQVCIHICIRPLDNQTLLKGPVTSRC